MKVFGQSGRAQLISVDLIVSLLEIPYFRDYRRLKGEKVKE